MPWFISVYTHTHTLRADDMLHCIFTEKHRPECTFCAFILCRLCVSVRRKGKRRSLHSDCHKSGHNSLQTNVITASNESLQAAQTFHRALRQARHILLKRRGSPFIKNDPGLIGFLYTPCDQLCEGK